MPSQLPCSLTKTAGGADLYADQNPAIPIGSTVYYNQVQSSTQAPLGIVPFSAVYPVYVPGVAPSVTNGVGLGVKIPAGVYLARLSVPNVGESPSGFTKACFTFTWDGANLTSGASANPSNDSGAPQAFISSQINVTTGLIDTFVWGFRNLVGAVTTAQCDIILLQKVDAFIPLF